MDKAEGRSVSLKFVLNSEDSVHFNIQHSKKTIVIADIFYFVLFVFIIFVLSLQGYSDFRSIAMILGIGILSALAVTALITLIFYYLLKLKSKRIFATDTIAQQEQSYIITDDGIDISTVSGTGKVNWNEVYRAKEYKTGFAVYVASNKAFIIPKRAFADDGQIRLFKEILGAHLEPAKVKIKKT